MRSIGLSGVRAATLLAMCAHWALPSLAVDTDTFSLEELEGVDAPTNYYTDLHPCPQACADLAPSNWTVYNDFARFSRCDEPLLFDFALYTSVMDAETPTKLRVCTSGNANTTVNALFNGTQAAPVARRNTGATCVLAEAKPVETAATFEFSRNGGESNDKALRSVGTALEKLEAHFASTAPCDETFMFAYHQGVLAAVHTGPAFGRDTVKSVAARFLEQVHSGETATTMAAQLCGEGRNAHHVFGLVVDTAGNMTAVQDVVKGWHSAQCLGDFESKIELADVAVWEDQSDLVLLSNSTFNGTNSNFNATRRGTLQARADCKTTTVVAGDGCASLAKRCGISANDFNKYNSDKDFCSSLVPDQRVCCSSGTLPDISPKPNSDGTCFSHTVQSGDTCSQLAGKNGLKVKDIDTFNNGTTWGWYGCGKLMADMNICLSKGKPPMPAPVANAVCGPTKVGTQQPSGDQELKDLNPCPLNACCNVWGQCGISGEFCTEKKSPSGNPGTSGLRNGCVSSCGMDIINKADGPGGFGRVGYYETWNFNRPCLNQHVENADTDGTYTIIHWAFAEINTNDWTVKIVDKFKQWDKFKKITPRKVISFGGWAFSTEPGTYDILRQAMSPNNRATFAKNVAAFVKKEGLDGVDFDWEYPGADDIPGTPAGSPADGSNYLKFLTTMRAELPKDKSISIAAPASYWYLRNFPIKQMAKTIDYIVYMTYDLHGQWDAGSQWSTDGCPTGNCLRSHVNLTETEIALSMITKAGVNTNKIYVGESSYGRSFKMAKAGCAGPMCTWIGSSTDSPAKKGRCTDTAGYISNAEIMEMIDSYDPDQGMTPVKAWHDSGSNSDMMIYDNTEWVAYMSPTTKNTRRAYWQGFNFAGTIDWATDLQSFTGDDARDPLVDEDEDDSEDDDEPMWPPPGPCMDSFDTIEAIEGADIPAHCVPVYTVEVMARTLADAMAQYDELMAEGYDKRFNTYAKSVAGGGKDAVEEWMHDNGNDYFTCDVVETVECCKSCKVSYNKEELDAGACKYCDNKNCNGWSSVCENPEVSCNPTKVDYFNATGPCPPDFSLRQGKEPTGGFLNTIYWYLDAGKEDEFYAKLYADTGISDEFLSFDNVQRYKYCTPAQKENCEMVGWDFGIPVPHGYDADDVINPKDIVEDAYANLQAVVGDLPKAVDQLKKGTYPGSAADLADALALPVFMVEDAVANIQTISDTIEEMNREKRKAIILAFLSAIFFFVPIVGQLASTFASLATIGRIIAVLGTIGEIATDIYTVVDTKGNDPLAIFSIVLAPLAIFDVVQIAKAAKIARAMDKAEVAKLGRIGEKVDQVKELNSVCKLNKRTIFPNGAMSMSGLNGEMRSVGF